jgi:hypothetical protein
LSTKFSLERGEKARTNPSGVTEEELEAESSSSAKEYIISLDEEGEPLPL